MRPDRNHIHSRPLSMRSCSQSLSDGATFRNFPRPFAMAGYAIVPRSSTILRCHWSRLGLFSPILTCSAAIFYHHSVAGLESPTGHHLVAIIDQGDCYVFTSGRKTRQAAVEPLLTSDIRLTAFRHLAFPSGSHSARSDDAHRSHALLRRLPSVFGSDDHTVAQDSDSVRSHHGAFLGEI
jgi:hypothetical protein